MKESVQKLFETWKSHEKTLQIFINLKKNDKLMHQGGGFYIEPYGYLQSWKRWWYGENRHTTLLHLNHFFTKFIQFLDLLIKEGKNNLDLDLINLVERICEFVNKIIPGIHMLKKTYVEFVELHCKVDSIILTLLDFKTVFNEIPQKKKKKKRSRSFNNF